MLKKLEKIERSIGGLKFAVLIIVAFSIFMIVGTFLESYYGTDFANRLIYKRWPFMLLQLLMFLSIYFAMMLRFPPKKRLYGFYIIHTGLILVGCGSFITYYAGIDGSITLSPNEPNRDIVINEDIVKIRYPEEGLEVTRQLPYKAFTTDIDQSYKNIRLRRFFPYAEKVLEWKKFDNSNGLGKIYHSGSYQIANANISQEFTLSLHPESFEFESTLSLGPLTVNYLASPMANCFAKEGKSKLIIWDQAKKECFTPEEKNIPIKETNSGNRFLVLQEGTRLFSFFPDVTPWPMDENIQVIKDSHLRIFSKALFEEKPHLFIFGNSIAYFDKEEKKWTVAETKENSITDLPWMGFQLRTLKHVEDKYPTYTPRYVMPIQKNGALIKGELKALEVEINEEKYWVTDVKPLSLMVEGKRIDIYLTKQTLTLPFEFVLKQFKMDTDPGTMNPASYESFVTLFTNSGPQDHHIYMNNPLKYEGFTFYQASYGKSPQGYYVSTLSANVDQGRAIKYLGSLLLVLGSILHYFLNKSRYMKKKNNSNSSEESIQIANPHMKGSNNELV